MTSDRVRAVQDGFVGIRRCPACEAVSHSQGDHFKPGWFICRNWNCDVLYFHPQSGGWITGMADEDDYWYGSTMPDNAKDLL